MPCNNDNFNDQYHDDHSLLGALVLDFWWRLAGGLQSMVLRFVPTVPIHYDIHNHEHHGC